jgi:midasin (ATPase involved in ribosome maturation)
MVGKGSVKSIFLRLKTVQTNEVKYCMPTDRFDLDAGIAYFELNQEQSDLLKEGLFYKAYTKGRKILLDEINLASESILQCIEQSLDSKILSIELNGCLFKEYKMNENFCLIATQNPKEGFYSNKRKEHSYRLLSRFQIIRFDEIDDIILEKLLMV